MVFVETTPSRPGTPLENRHPTLSISTLREAESRLAPLPSSWRFSFLEDGHRLTPIATSADTALKEQIALIQDKIHKHLSGKIVFSRNELSQGDYYDKLPQLSLERQVKAAEIALREVQKYPAGFFEKIGLKTFGII